jgi:YYY domain-containing protein
MVERLKMENQTSGNETINTAKQSDRSYYFQLSISLILLFIIMAAGAYLRIVGMNWDDNQHLHPDERFLTMVESGLQPVKNLALYFNTDASTLNPNNVGYGFYVYGDMPIVIVRYLAEALKQTGYDQVFLIGRYASAFVDLLTVLVVFMIVDRMYRKPLMAALAAGFTAFAVLQIQLSHFFTVDTFTNLFAFLAFYFAVWVMTDIPKKQAEELQTEDLIGTPAKRSSLMGGLLSDWGSLPVYILFGVFFGMALASKISVYQIAALLPLAAVIRLVQLPVEERKHQFVVMARNLVIAAFFSVLLFRICQPYAFKGPGFFDVGLNPKWVSNIMDLKAQSDGDVDFPPALQWASRPPWFAWENMVVWGQGLPLGILSWVGFLWMAWRIFKGAWKEHIMLWGWTAFFFLTQSQVFNPTMRYLLFVYPSLAIIAAWMVFDLWEVRRREGIPSRLRAAWSKIRKPLAVVLGVGVLAATAAWAYGFVQIYTRPVTRVAASDWIYQNVPGPIDLKVESGGKIQSQPLPFRQGTALLGNRDIVMAFTAVKTGVITDVTLPHVMEPVGTPDIKTLTVSISKDFEGTEPLGSGSVTDTFINTGGDSRGRSFTINLFQAAQVIGDQPYYFRFHYDNVGVALASTPTYTLNGQDGTVIKDWLPDPVEVVRPGSIYQTSFDGLREGMVNHVSLTHVLDWEAQPGEKTLQLTLVDPANNQIQSRATVKSAFLAGKDRRGASYDLTLDKPFSITLGQTYILQLELLDGNGAIAVYGARHALESSWDDAIPLGIDGFNSFDYSNGIYRSDLNFEMYFDDSADKLARFETILDQADYIYITSNRQYATTVRVPERYPLTSVFYRDLIGCPANADLISCYYVATPGMYQGNLGFELADIAQSEPTIGPFTFNSQFAEEAFTVYDHPKVLIFKKTADYSADKMRSILESVDLSNVMHITPKQASNTKGNMMLPQNKLAQQQSGGTWSEIFNRAAVINQIPAVGAVYWYVMILLLGWVCFPLVRFTFSGLPDKGFPLTRLVGMLALSFLTWLAGSAGLSINALSISGVFGLLVVLNAGLFWMQRKTLLADLKENWKRYLLAEMVFLGLFLLFLAVRLGNPDLWHPSKGGEKPMDFSYLNAVIKSTTFPPYDPWYAGGYINYYYFGFVLVGVPIKWLGIIPSIAYNLILPTFFAFFGTAAFSTGWNLMWAFGYKLIKPDPEKEEVIRVYNRRPLAAGFCALGLSLLVGNLGTVRMIWQGFMRLATPNFEAGNLLDKFIWTFQGIVMFIQHAQLPYGMGDWYWIPSRAIPGESITEFPLFTFLYADPHAHLYALPLTLLALAWSISILLQQWNWEGELRWKQILQGAATFVVGGMVIGCLYPTNTWDMPVYLAIGCLAVFYTICRHTFMSNQEGIEIWRYFKRIALGLAAAGALVGLAFLLYQPFSHWFVQAYNSVDIWKGDHTQLPDYLTHWGLFLFIISTWMLWETIDWMDKTPLSRLRLLAPYWSLIILLLVAFIAIVVLLQVVGVNIAWVALILAFWALILIIRPNQPDQKRFILFLVGSASVLTLAVELVALHGDIGRMNTVFKFYLQAWTLFSISAAAALVWMYPAVMRYWLPAWRGAWTTVVGLLIGSAALFTLLGGADKITDRMTTLAPHTLDGMAYMQYAHYNDSGKDMNLSEDYRAIQWMQDHIQGSPVIVEANTPEYRWGTRFTIYTGLPGVVGWNWHQRQQRAALNTEAVFNRVMEVGSFYSTFSMTETETFLKKYNVKYIIVGQLERITYASGDLQKFETYNGQLWDEIYRDGSTVIYQVK